MDDSSMTARRSRLLQRRLSGALAALLGAIAASGCTDPVERTQVRVVLEAEDSVRARIRSIEVNVRSGLDDEAAWDLVLSRQFTPRATDAGWPLDLRFDAPAGDTSYYVSAQARGADDEVVTAVRAWSRYARGRTVDLRLRFDEACAARSMPCASTFTCEAGQCKDPFRGEVLSEDGAVSDASIPSAPMESDAEPATRPQRPADGSCSGGTCTPVDPRPGDPADAPQCAARDGQGVCQSCPPGFVREAGQCSPGLTVLEVEGAALEPPFDPERTDYTVDLPLTAAEAKLRLEASGSATVQVKGERVESTAAVSVPLELGENELVISLDAAGHPSRTYRLTMARTSQERSRLSAMQPSPGDAFGVGLAASADRIVAGAPYADGTSDMGAAEDSGAAYVFERSGEGWQQRAWLTPRVVRPQAHFGFAIATDGDRIVVTAPEESGGGAAYVFERSGDAWREVAVLREAQARLFGRAVALRGDRLVVGDPGDSTLAEQSGALYIYERRGDTWQRAQVIHSARPSRWEWLGSAVVLGDDTILTAATGRPVGNVDSGVVVAYRLEGSAWREVDEITPDPPELGSFFGTALAASGDDVVIGAFNGSAGLTGGSVYSYARQTDGTYVQTSVLRPSNTQPADYFGSGVALQGNLLVVGASQDRSDVPGLAIPAKPAVAQEQAIEKSGAFYLFERDGDGWRQKAQMKSSAPVRSEEFGRNVLIRGGEVVVTASSDADRPQRGTRPGAVYVFR